jgi:threonine/homoserine/homoserine lactone efflux protein
MIAAFSVISVTVGTVFAWMAGRHARYQQAMEAFGGILLIAGFALLGYGLECVFGPP